MLRLILSTYFLFITIIGDNVIHAYKPVSENTKTFLFLFFNFLTNQIQFIARINFFFQVVLIHGVMTGAKSMQLIQQEIKKVTPMSNSNEFKVNV